VTTVTFPLTITGMTISSPRSFATVLVSTTALTAFRTAARATTRRWVPALHPLAFQLCSKFLVLCVPLLQPLSRTRTIEQSRFTFGF
jgi:hypothetical protein